MQSPGAAQVSLSVSAATESRWGDYQAAAGVGPWQTRTRIRKVVQTIAAVGPDVESQASVSRVLRAEIEQTAQRQAAVADAESGAVAGESNDE